MKYFYANMIKHKVSDLIIKPLSFPPDFILSTIGWSFGGIPPKQEDAKEKEKKAADVLDERYLVIGTKVTMKASNLPAEITDVMTGKVKITVNRIETEWMENSKLQKEIKETL